MTQALDAQEIDFRECRSLSDYEQCVRIEHTVWGESLAVPVPIFVVARHAGGQILGAFESGGVIGFTLAFAALRDRQVFLHSHIAVVLPQFRNRGVGRRLKLFQREEAVRRGIDLIEWTFDPLDLKNAYFNLVRLGAVARRYLPNCYGVTDSPLHAGLPTDRLVAEWWLRSDRVQSVAAGSPRPGPTSVERITIPAELATLRQSDRAAALGIQLQARERFQKCLARGLAATGVERHDGATDYLFEPTSGIQGLKLPEIPKQD